MVIMTLIIINCINSVKSLREPIPRPRARFRILTRLLLANVIPMCYTSRFGHGLES